MKIAVLDDYQNAVRSLKAYERVASQDVVVFDDTAADVAALVARLKDADAVVLNMQRTRLPAAVIEALPNLKVISQTGRNTAHIDIDAASARGVVVSAGGAGAPSTVAELTWGLILASRRSIPQEVQALKQGRWQTTVGMRLAGKTLGIYAFGRIGSQVAAVGKAFGMRVVCLGRDGSTTRAKEAGYDIAETREAFFAEADVLSLHLLLNDGTRGIVTADDLARMKPDALLVNTSRAQLIAPGALVAALHKGRPGYAALDVFEQEPIAGNDPLLKMPNVIATPHLGYVDNEVYENIYAAAFDQILAFADGKPVNVVNEEALAAAGTKKA